MTIRYECDRCHKQFANGNRLTRMILDNENIDKITFHYCSDCTMILLNAIQITNDGTYQGSLKADDTIGKPLGGYSDKQKD